MAELRNLVQAEREVQGNESLERKIELLEKSVQEMKDYALPRIEKLEPTPVEVEIANSMDNFQEWLNAQVV